MGYYNLIGKVLVCETNVMGSNPINNPFHEGNSFKCVKYWSWKPTLWVQIPFPLN